MITANKQLVAQHGPELVAAAKKGGAQLRFEAAVAGAIPVIRVVQESLGAVPIEKVTGIVNGTTNYILTEMARERALLRRGAGAGPGPRLRRGRSRPRTSAAPTPRRRWRSSRGSPSARRCGSNQVPYEGIEKIQPDDLAYAKELGLSLKLLGVAEKQDGEVSVRVFPCFLYPGHPLAPIEGAFNAVMVEAPVITEITMSGPGAGGPQTASAVLGDLVSVINGGSPLFEETSRLKIAKHHESAFYLHLEVEDRHGVLAKITEILGKHEVSVRSVVQRGHGRRRAADHGHAPRRRAELRRGAEADRQAQGPALEAPRDPGDRGGVRLVPAGLIERYRDKLPLEDGDPVVTLNEGSTPLIHAEKLSERVGATVYLKFEGANPTGSFKDRGMTVAVSRAKGAGRRGRDLRLDREHRGQRLRLRGQGRACGAP